MYNEVSISLSDEYQETTHTVTSYWTPAGKFQSYRTAEATGTAGNVMYVREYTDSLVYPKVGQKGLMCSHVISQTACVLY